MYHGCDPETKKIKIKKKKTNKEKSLQGQLVQKNIVKSSQLSRNTQVKSQGSGQEVEGRKQKVFPKRKMETRII